MLDAAELGDEEKFIKAYQCQDADINHGDRHGQTSLWLAASYGHLPVVNLLLKQADTKVNQAETRRGTTPLYMASQWGHVEVVKALLAH